MNIVDKLSAITLLALPIILLLAATNVSYAITHYYNDDSGVFMWKP